MESEIELVLNDMKDKLETTDNETNNIETKEKQDSSDDISDDEQGNHSTIKKQVIIPVDDRENNIKTMNDNYDYTPRYISDYDSSLKQNKLEELLTYDNFFDLIEPFPKITEIEDLTHMTELKSWLYNSLDRINIWHLYQNKPKLEYINALRYMSFKIREVMLYYYDYTIDYAFMNDKIKKINKNQEKRDISTDDMRNLLINWKESAQEHIQRLMDDYPCRFSYEGDFKIDTIYDNYRSWCCRKRTRFNPLKSIRESMKSIQLTSDQYIVMNNEYLRKLEELDKKRKKYKIYFGITNFILQTSSIILPALITFKDTSYFENMPELNGVLDYSTIGLSVFLGIITNLTIFFKVNQKYSLYTQYNNKIRQEIRRFLTSSEKYFSNDVKETYRLYPQFSNIMEKYLEELNNQEYDFIVGNKDKDDKNFADKEQIITPSNDLSPDNKLNFNLRNDVYHEKIKGRTIDMKRNPSTPLRNR